MLTIAGRIYRTDRIPIFWYCHQQGPPEIKVRDSHLATAASLITRESSILVLKCFVGGDESCRGLATKIGYLADQFKARCANDSVMYNTPGLRFEARASTSQLHHRRSIRQPWLQITSTSSSTQNLASIFVGAGNP